jgi:hypothetical protein
MTKEILQGRHRETTLQWNRNAKDPGRFETIWPLRDKTALQIDNQFELNHEIKNRYRYPGKILTLPIFATPLCTAALERITQLVP